jgi:REP element-mobilizing transposase RayT
VNFPLAYHITFGTYGTRLHGDERGTVDRRSNHFGEPIIDQCEEWEQMERHRLKYPPRVLTREQCVEVELLIPRVCARGKWTYHTCAAAPDHVHTVLTAQAEGEAVRMWLKRWVTQGLNGRWPLRDDQVWWAECGSVKWVWEEDYFQRAVGYVAGQRRLGGC